MREAGSSTRSTGAELFARQGREPRIRMELSTNESIIQAIVAGLGVSILSRPTYALANDLPQLVTLDVVGFPVDRPWQFVYRSVSSCPRSHSRSWISFAFTRTR